jgi:hypothetical protein
MDLHANQQDRQSCEHRPANAADYLPHRNLFVQRLTSGQSLYCSSVTCSIHSTDLPSSASEM